MIDARSCSEGMSRTFRHWFLLVNFSAKPRRYIMVCQTSSSPDSKYRIQYVGYLIFFSAWSDVVLVGE